MATILRLIKGAGRKVFLTADHGLAHRVKKVSTFVAVLAGKACLFFLPSYGPNHNPNERVCKPVKADTKGRMAATRREDFEKKVRGSLRDLKRASEKSSPSFKSHRSYTPRDNEYTYRAFRQRAANACLL